MSDTPRTDAIETQTDAIENLDYIDRQDVWIAFARNLERELAAKDAEIERLRELLRFAWADDDLDEFSKSARRAYIDAIREELGMEAIK
jgi:hypothetical protein